MNNSEALSAPRPTLGQRVGARWRRDLVFFVIAALVIVADQYTKYLVRENLRLYEAWDHSFGFVRIVHVVNSGAAFGILQGQTPFLIITSLVGLGAIVLYYVYPPMDHGLIRVALGMQLGGAVGNLIDRVRVGEVTDFVSVSRFPTFNVADASISVSIVAVLAFFAFQEAERDPHADPGPPDDPPPRADDPSPRANDPPPDADVPSPRADDPSPGADDLAPRADDPSWRADDPSWRGLSARAGANPASRLADAAGTHAPADDRHED